MIETAEVMPGTSLSFDMDTSDEKRRAISVEMLPLIHANHLVNHADNFGEGWFDLESKKLKLQFQMVVLFSNSRVKEFVIAIPNTSERQLSSTQIASPGAAQSFSHISWSSESRFVVNEEIDFPACGQDCLTLDLIAVLADKREKVGIIHIKKLDSNNRPKSIDKNEFSPVEIAGERNALMKMLSGASWLHQGLQRIRKIDRLFLMAVVIPTLASFIYFGFIASDVYVSESRFVVRSPQRQANVGLGALFQGAGFSRSQEDTYTVHDYILSRDSLKKLDEKLAIGKEFSSDKVDIVSRFSGLDWDDSFEALHRFYQKQVKLDLDSSSSITTLSVKAFSPDAAYQINEQLLEMSEMLVNQLNERGRQDMIRFATEEVATAELKAKLAAMALSNYRNEKGVFNPEGQSISQLQQVSKMQEDLIASKILFAQISSLAKENPQLPSLQNRIDTLQLQSDTEIKKVVGGAESLSNKSAEYESLVLERSFADKQLAAALASLEQAHNEAQRKQLYLERIVQPSQPDRAFEPRRIRNILATFVLGLIVWGILIILIAGVKEHQD